MKKTNIMHVMTKPHQIPKVYKRWAAIITVVVLAAVVGVTSFINAPRDIGKDLVFLGKVNTSCEWWEIPLYIGFCSGPSYKYFFATDMNKDQLKEYFKNNKATYIDSSSLGGTFYSSEEDYRSDTIDFKLLNNQKEFYIEYYDKTQVVIKANGLKDIGKQHIISMTEESYKLAKEAL